MQQQTISSRNTSASRPLSAPQEIVVIQPNLSNSVKIALANIEFVVCEDQFPADDFETGLQLKRIDPVLKSFERPGAAELFETPENLKSLGFEIACDAYGDELVELKPSQYVLAIRKSSIISYLSRKNERVEQLSDAIVFDTYASAFSAMKQMSKTGDAWVINRVAQK